MGYFLAALRVWVRKATTTPERRKLVPAYQL
jgi:hypothetical protein